MMKRMFRSCLATGLVVLLPSLADAQVISSETCGRLASVKVPNTTILRHSGRNLGGEFGSAGLNRSDSGRIISSTVFYNDPKWDWRTFDLEHAFAAAHRIGADILDATNPDLSAFKQRGGKLLLFHGWSDANFSAETTVNFYKSVLDKMGPEAVGDWARLFLAPGMGHCGGGEGPNTFDAVDALERWVERGQAPARIEASHSSNGQIDRTRPLCPYPQVARYTGTGSIDDAANFVCRVP